MLKHQSPYPLFMNHSFWDFFRIRMNSKFHDLLIVLENEQRFEMIREAVKGFYPVSYMSLQSFKRFSELSQNEESKDIARKIYLTEKGDMPLIPGSEFEGIMHCDQLRIMFESLLQKQFDLPPPAEFSVVQSVDMENASITKSMAICDIIENTAPYVIHFYQDLLIQCQVAFNVPSEKIKRNYLDEHNLTEGATCEDQHIEMVTKMKMGYSDLENSEEYFMASKEFCQLVSSHFDSSLLRIEEIIKGI